MLLKHTESVRSEILPIAPTTVVRHHPEIMLKSVRPSFDIGIELYTLVFGTIVTEICTVWLTSYLRLT